MDAGVAGVKPKLNTMNPLALLQFFVPKRHDLLHKLYRRMHRAYAWILVAIDPELTIDEFLFGFVLTIILSIVLIFSLITLMIP